MKLLFIVMDLLAILAYPIVFVHGKLFRYSKPKERMRRPHVLVAIPSALER